MKERRGQEHDPRCMAGRMTKKERRDWEASAMKECGFVVHFVFDEFHGKPHPLSHLVNFHTHGFLETWGHPDLQIVFPLPERVVMGTLWNFADRVKAGEKFVPGVRYLGIAGEPYEVKLVEAEEAGRKILRVLIPDKHNKLPGDPGVERAFAIQTEV